MDYAKKENRQALFRHPVLGDPSFDSFEKLGTAIHRSSPPMEWAVNGSLFRDFDGVWYCYAGLYSFGYQHRPGEPYAHFLIYRSTDRGCSWTCLCSPFEDGFCFEGSEFPADCHPDATLTYDPRTGRYLLAYDYAEADGPCDPASGLPLQISDSGAAIAWAEHPSGPFHRLDQPIFRNKHTGGLLGKYNRMYATTVLPREHDYLALVLCDSDQYFAWALAAMTAPTIEGPWSRPQLLLSPELPGYHPAPVEFYPVYLVDGEVYAPATSVAGNRNYQCLFCAPLEQAHLASAWTLAQDGSLWHARRDPDEHYGIWGQTFHGFVEEGRLIVMYPSLNEERFGVLSLAARPLEQPFSDGFTLSGHTGPSLTLTRASYAGFRLEAEFTLSGTADFAWGYQGVLGPDRPASVAVAHRDALSGHPLLRLTAAPPGDSGDWRVLNEQGEPLAAGSFAGRETETPIALSMACEAGELRFSIDGWEQRVAVGPERCGPLALIAHEFSLVTVSRYQVHGEAQPYRMVYSARDALLGAGQNLKDWCAEENEQFSGEGAVRAKWNVIGDCFTLLCPRGPELGCIAVYLDGRLLGSATLTAPEKESSAPVFCTGKVPYGRHGIAVCPWEGRIIIDRLLAEGEPFQGEEDMP